MSAALQLSEDGLLALVASHIADRLPPERVEEIAERVIAQRIGQLTLDQAARHLGCKNLRQLTDFCREQGIPIEHFGAKKRFIRIADIEAAQARVKVKLTPRGAATGTTIAPAI